MGEINTSGWGEFVVGDLFAIRPTKSYKSTNAELIDGGKSPVVVNSAYNNGIGGTSSKATTEIGNMITFSDTVDANTIFYQEHPFIGYSHVQGLYPIGQHETCWSKESLMFFAASFRKSALVKGFDYGNKFRRDIASTLKAKLPIDSTGNPDWQYMEDYMRNIEGRVSDSLSKLESAKEVENNKIDVSGWGEFRLGKLLNLKTGETKGTGIFNIVNSVAYHGKDIEETDKNTTACLNYVTRSKFNNGIKCKVSKKDSYAINPAGTISFGAENADFFYQTEEYITGNKMYYIDTSVLSKYSCAFIKSILEATFTANYSFSDGMIPARIYDESIKLPIDSQCNPDWQYMEDYMRNIEARVGDSLSKLISISSIQ